MFRTIVSATAGVSLLALAHSVVAQQADTVAAQYAAMPSVQDIALSPSGNRIAVISPGEGQSQIVSVADMSSSNVALKPISRNSVAGNHIAWCEWATDERLVCSAYTRQELDGVKFKTSRLIAMDSDGTNAEYLPVGTNRRSLGFVQFAGSILSWKADGQIGRLLMTRAFVPENSTGSRQGRMDEGLGVVSIDAGSLKTSTVEKGRREASYYLADENGQVRIRRERDVSPTGQLQETERTYYRPLGGRWERLTIADAALDEFDPVAVEAKTNSVYGFGDYNGFLALYRVKLDGTGASELVMHRDGIDVDQVVRTGPAGPIVGASYAADRRMVELFDKDLAALQKAFRGALPGDPLIEFADASDDGKKLLIVASSDTNPGMLYLFDRTTNKLEEILPLRAALDGAKMAPMKPVTYTATDGTQVPAYLTLPVGGAQKGLPAIVMPHGGPSARDEWGFDWLVQYFAHRGYAVLQPNYRGSSGYGADWYGENGFQNWPAAIGDVNDAGRWLVQQGIAAPDKLAIVGWSYGGYAALQSQVTDPALYKAVVAIAPVTDLEMLRQEGYGFSNNRLRSDFIGNGPHVVAGSPARHADAFRAPVLLMHGDEDLNVGIAQARKMDRELSKAGKQVKLIEFEGLEHSLPDAKARYTLLTETDAFLRKSLGL